MKPLIGDSICLLKTQYQRVDETHLFRSVKAAAIGECLALSPALGYREYRSGLNVAAGAFMPAINYGDVGNRLVCAS